MTMRGVFTDQCSFHARRTCGTIIPRAKGGGGPAKGKSGGTSSSRYCLAARTKRNSGFWGSRRRIGLGVGMFGIANALAMMKIRESLSLSGISSVMASGDGIEFFQEI